MLQKNFPEYSIQDVPCPEPLTTLSLALFYVPLEYLLLPNINQLLI